MLDNKISTNSPINKENPEINEDMTEEEKQKIKTMLKKKNKKRKRKEKMKILCQEMEEEKKKMKELLDKNKLLEKELNKIKEILEEQNKKNEEIENEDIKDIIMINRKDCIKFFDKKIIEDIKEWKEFMIISIIIQKK